MTNLNKLFLRYFIVTIAGVLLIITLISNFGASIFFKSFIRKTNNEKNEKIVEIVQLMVDDDRLTQSMYPMLLGLWSRQEDVNINFYKDGTEIFSSASNKTGQSIMTRPSDISRRAANVIYLEYDVDGYTLEIGRAKDPLFNIANANFIKTLNVLYIAVFAAAMALAVLAAWILSKKFNKPIMQLKENVNHISMNRFDKIKNCDTKARELTELSEDIKNLAVQMQKEEGMRKRLSNDIVHELKTPISVLSTNIEAILDGVYEADEERMSVLLSQTNRLARLVNNLSELTLLETEYENASMEKTNISNILESIYTVYLPAATDKKITLHKDINSELYIHGNEDRLLQVFVNILSNAMKYTDAEGHIYIRVFSHADEVVCEIEDTGTGIDEKDQPFIFNRFYRGDESRSRETGGSGIGLAIAKAVVSSHGGEIKLDSKKGEGTKISTIFQKSP